MDPEWRRVYMKELSEWRWCSTWLSVPIFDTRVLMSDRCGTCLQLSNPERDDSPEWCFDESRQECCGCHEISWEKPKKKVENKSISPWYR